MFDLSTRDVKYLPGIGCAAKPGAASVRETVRAACGCRRSAPPVHACYNVGDEFIFERDEEYDHFWHGGLNTLVKTSADPNTVAGGPKMPHCSEAWDAISRYIYTGLQGGSIMKGW